MDGVLGLSAAPTGRAMLASMTIVAPPATAGAVRVRPVDPLDCEELVGLYARLSAESRHARFFGAMRIDERAARTMVEVDGGSRLGLVATERASGAIVGHLCLEPSGPDAAEIGIVVADIWQGHGIGRALLVEGLAWARRHRLRELVGYALSENSRILRLASTLGVPCSIRSVGDGLVSATLAVEPGP